MTTIPDNFIDARVKLAELKPDHPDYPAMLFKARGITMRQRSIRIAEGELRACFWDINRLLGKCREYQHRTDVNLTGVHDALRCKLEWRRRIRRWLKALR